MKKLRVIFFGTPGLSANILAYLSDVLDIVAIVTNPDQPAGRGHELTMSPV
jgi:methionyl-tRNA formyltransferase